MRLNRAFLLSVLMTLFTSAVKADDHTLVSPTNVWTAQNIVFKDGQQQAFRAGLAKFMNSDMGKSMPGQVFYNWIVSDGDAPATHSLVLVFPSMAAWSNWNVKYFTAAASGNNSSAEWGKTFAASVDSASTITARIHKSWGPVGAASGPSEWVPFYTEDLATFTADFSAYMQTPTGKGFKGTVAIHECIACGEQGFNAGFSVNHESPESFDEWWSTGRNSEDFTRWVAKANAIADFPGNWMSAQLDSYPAQ